MDKPQYAVRAEDVPPRITPSNDPEPFATRMAGRIKRPLGDFFGLRNFGVNLTRRMPDAGPVCPCGSGSVYAACCGRFIDQGMLPATAEQLMRSRYTAFTRANEPYLLATWHETTRPRSLDFDPEESVKWLGLRIDKVGEGGANDDRGLVCFIATWRVGGGRVQRLQECSRFVREQGRWFYLDGDVRT